MLNAFGWDLWEAGGEPAPDAAFYAIHIFYSYQRLEMFCLAEVINAGSRRQEFQSDVPDLLRHAPPVSQSTKGSAASSCP
jgi:hypothetical protein